MRISDWSSDVCSSDLGLGLVACRLQRRAPVEQMGIGGQRGFGFFEGTQHRAVEFGERRLAVSLGAVDPRAHRLLIWEGPPYTPAAAEKVPPPGARLPACTPAARPRKNFGSCPAAGEG